MTRFLPHLMAVFFFVGVGTALPQSTICGTVNITIPANAPMPYNVEAAGAINDTLRDCDDRSLVINLEYLGDTLKLSNEIIVTSRPDSSTTTIIGKGKTGPLIITENSLSDPMLLDIRTPAATTISNVHFVRRVDNSSVHTVVVGAKGSIFRDCHFFRTDASSLASGALLSVTADSVLVERSLFRAPPVGKGRSIAISASGGADRNEYRSNIFYSTGLLLNGGRFHVYANTFAGSRDEYNAIIVGSGITSGSAVAIEHNLFALKADTLPPIHFAGTVTSSDAIIKNAYSRSRPTLVPAVYGTSSLPVTLIAPGANNNVVLPRGFSKYATGVEFKEFPLVQLRTDSLLTRSHANFGEIPRLFSNTFSTWTTIPDISAGLPNSKLWFSGSNAFTPFIQGRTWQAGIKVGALVDLDNRQVPSPLDSGGLGTGLAITSDPADSTRMRVNAINLNSAYYDTTIAPSEMVFFFSNTQSRLNANDSNSLKNPASGTPYYSRRAALNFDNILAVPREVRTGGTIYVKLLHYNASGQAPVLSVGAVAQVTGIPAYPINDLTVPALATGSDTTTGRFVMSVTKQGSEAIDSIRVTAVRVGGGATQEVVTQAAPAAGASATFTFLQLPRGQFQFHATPIARVGGNTQAGQATALSRVFNSSQLASDTAWVTHRTTGCPGLGTKADPFCTIELALTELKTKEGGAILVRNGTPALPFQNLEIAGPDSFAVTIAVPIAAGAFDPVHRAVFRGSSGTPALTISRKNVNVQGFFFEMPPGATSPAVNVTAGGVTMDGCIFRPVTNTGLAGTAISIETPGNQEMRFISNLIWGFATGVRINTASTGLRILHNTFFDDAQVFPAGTVGISAHAGAVNAVIANNFFSGSATPLDAGFSGKTPKLDHNAYSSYPPQLQGLAESGTLDSVPRLSTVDFTKSDWPSALQVSMDFITECSEVKACFGLYAGSSTDPFGPAITTDVMGKARLGKPEVGAFEAEATTTSLRGLLQVSVVSPRPNDRDAHSRLAFTVVRKSLDPTDADSLHVWWSKNPDAPLNSSILVSHQIHYSLGDLTRTGTLEDTAILLDANTTYYVYAALGRTTGGARLLGYRYRDAGTTQLIISDSDCVLGSGSRVCPKDGFFRGPDDLYLTQVTFAENDTGLVRVPVFSFPSVGVVGKVDFSGPMPHIRFNIETEKAKASGTGQKWKATIRMMEDPGEALKGKDLFILSPEANGLPRYVPTWEIKREGADVFLIIEGIQNGAHTYAFGSAFANPLVESGTFAMTTPADQRPTFNFKDRQDSASVNFTIKGSGFTTANPLVMITPVPAGGTLENPLHPSKFGNTADPKFNKTLFLTQGLSGLADSLRNELLHRYYLRAVAADSATTHQVGQHQKPFSLEPVTIGALANAMLAKVPSVAVTEAGETGEIDVEMPVFSKYKDGENYVDGIQRTSRSIEVVFTVFDGARVSRSKGYIRTEFSDINLHSNEKKEFDPRIWNLFSYPWAEADTGTLARIVKASTWNQDEMRLMRYKGSGKDAKDFLIYDGANPAEIRFHSGNAVWSGLTGIRYYEPVCFSGISLDYEDFTLNLAPNAWNDFGLPFNFPMKWRDILNASGLTGQEFTTWRYNPGTAGANGGWEALSATSVVHPWEGFTAKHTAAIALKFPVLDSSRSATPLAKPGAGELWSARVQAWNATARMNLRIGKAASEARIPEPPDVPGQDFRVGLKRLRPEGAELLSQHLQAGEDWRGHWSLSGTASKQAIRLAVSDNAGDIPLYLVETLARKAIPLAKGTELVLTPEDLKTGDYHLVAGDSRYVEDILSGLVPLHMLALSNYPNPFSGSTLIRYALPETFGKVEFRMKIRDSRGRLVWEKVQRGSNSLRHLWDGRDRGGKQAGAGFYTLEVEAHAPGKTTQRAVRRLLKM